MRPSHGTDFFRFWHRKQCKMPMKLLTTFWFYSRHAIQKLTNCLFHFLCVGPWLETFLILLARMGVQILIQHTLDHRNIPFWRQTDGPGNIASLRCEPQKPISQLFQNLLFDESTYQYIPVCTSTYVWYILVYTGMYQYEPVWTSVYGYIQVCTRMC